LGATICSASNARTSAAAFAGGVADGVADAAPNGAAADSAAASDAAVSVLIPAYNEAATIATVLAQLLRLGPVVREIIVVDDGSTDGTAAIANEWAARHPQIRVFRLEHNQGKTAAVQFAIAQAQGDVIIVQDADLEYDPAEIPQVLAPILEGRADVVYGSRFLVRRAARVLYFYHYLANKLLTLLSNLLTNRNLSDIETCYKCFRAEVIKPLRLTSRGFGMEIEITALISQTAARTYEVPISYHGRTYAEGKKIGVWDGLAAVGYILRYNLLAPWGRRVRQYVATVNRSLAERRKQRPPVPVEVLMSGDAGAWRQPAGASEGAGAGRGEVIGRAVGAGEATGIAGAAANAGTALNAGLEAEAGCGFGAAVDPELGAKVGDWPIAQQPASDYSGVR
jgi:hypothetical protein